MPERVTATIDPDEVDDERQAGWIYLVLLFILALFQNTGKRYVKQALMAIVDRAFDTPGLVAFYDFRSPLSDELACQVAEECERTTPGFPNINLSDWSLIQEVHEILSGTEEGADRKRGDDLPFDGIGLLLDACHTFVLEILRADDDEMLLAVRAAVKHIKHHRHGRTRTLPKKDHTLFHMALPLVQHALQSIHQSLQDAVTADAEERGGAPTDASIRDLAARFSRSPDLVAALSSLTEQFAALGATLPTSASHDPIGGVREIQKFRYDTNKFAEVIEELSAGEE